MPLRTEDMLPTYPTLLAIDLGLRAGFACFSLSSRPTLLWYRSQHFSSVGTLKRAIPHVLQLAAPLATLVLEGDAHLADLWSKLAEKRGAAVLRVRPETWRQALLLPREQRHGVDAKAAAHHVASECIAGMNGKRPKAGMNDDVAEAICIGLYGLTVRVVPSPKK